MTPCPHALHTMLTERIREMVGDPGLASAEQVQFVLIECRHPAGHRGRHISADGKAAWTGKLDEDEMAFADALRSRRGELTAELAETSKEVGS